MQTNCNTKVGLKPDPLFTIRKHLLTSEKNISTELPRNFLPLDRKHSLDSKFPTLRRKEAWNVSSAPQPINHHVSRLESIDIRPQTSSAYTKNDLTRQSCRQSFLQSTQRKKSISNSFWMNDSMELPGEIADLEFDNSCFSKYRPLPAIGICMSETTTQQNEKRTIHPYDQSLSSDNVSYSSTSSPGHSKVQSKMLRHKRKKMNRSSSPESSSSDESSKGNALFKHVQQGKNKTHTDNKPRPLIRSNTYDVIKPFLMNIQSENEEMIQTADKTSDLQLYDFEKPDDNIVKKPNVLVWPPTPLNSDEIVLAIQLPNGDITYGYFHKSHPLYTIINYIEKETKNSYENYYIVTQEVPKRVFMDLRQSIRKVNLNSKTFIMIKNNLE